MHVVASAKAARTLPAKVSREFPRETHVELMPAIQRGRSVTNSMRSRPGRGRRQRQRSGGKDGGGDDLCPRTVQSAKQHRETRSQSSLNSRPRHGSLRTCSNRALGLMIQGYQW